MNASNWVTFLELLGGGGAIGGAVKVAATLTRIAVSLENMVTAHKELTAQVHDHEARITRGGL